MEIIILGRLKPKERLDFIEYTEEGGLVSKTAAQNRFTIRGIADFQSIEPIGPAS
jgi:hypothetical protein